MKLNKKVLLTLFITILAIFCISGKVEATYSASSKTVDSGASVSITVESTTELENFDVECTDTGGLTYKACTTSVQGALPNSAGKKISYAFPGGKAKILGTYTFTAPKVSKDTKYTVKFDVNGTIVTSNITVIAEKTKEDDKNQNDGGSTENKNTNSSSNNGTTNNNSTGNNNTTNNDSGSTTTKPAAKSTNAYLSTLGVRISQADANELGVGTDKYDFKGFSKSSLSYKVTVPYEVESLKVSYKAAHSGATVKVTGNTGFDVGSNNKITIKVTAEDEKTTKTYTIKVTRLAEEEEKPGNIIDDDKIDGLFLTSLNIEGIELSPEFSKDVYAYTATLSNNLTEVEVNAVANKENASIEVSGNTDLIVGENTINIVVKESESTSQAVYQITLTKESTTVTTIGEENNFMSSLIDNIKSYIVIGIIIVVLIIATIITLIVLLRKENKRIKEQETEEEYNVYENDENEFEENKVEEQKIEEVTDETETKNEGRRTRRKEKGRHSK